MIKLEQNRASYFADFVAYPVAIVLGVIMLVARAPDPAWFLLLCALAGFFAWSLVEYVLHRFLFHHVQPFKGWHDEHHKHPYALIGTPTAVSLALIILLGFVPLIFAVGLWPALAAIVGLTCGYFLYLVVHHAVHHWKTKPGSWMRARQQDHARHHAQGVEGWYGVITPFWDRVFSTNNRGGVSRNTTPGS